MVKKFLNLLWKEKLFEGKNVFMGYSKNYNDLNKP
jgi:hypothetical protein